MENLITSDHLALENLSFDLFRKEVLKDYRLVCESREASLLGRKEVLTGKAKFGIFGDGKEVPQVAAAKFFRPGDFYAGYYRDQTLGFALGISTIEEFFSQLYADPDINHDPHSAGRNMNSHFSSPLVDEDGEFLDLVHRKNFTAGLAPTAAHVPRSLGLAYASKAFRQIRELSDLHDLSVNGNEICFCTIGDASTSEGHFWEILNAAGVLQVPLAIFVWDDGYGISVPVKYQTTKGSISEVLRGFQKEEGTNGIDIYKVKAWDYAGMCETFEAGLHKIRVTHTPALFHVEELTQPQGHSTSGSHERYKTPERLEWERTWDAMKKMKEWIIENALASAEELEEIHTKAKDLVRNSKNAAWEKCMAPIQKQVSHALTLIQELVSGMPEKQEEFEPILRHLSLLREPNRRDVMHSMHKALVLSDDHAAAASLRAFYQELIRENNRLYNTHLYQEGRKKIENIEPVHARFAEDAPIMNGYEILNKYFDELFARNPKVLAFGEDLGQIGDVNQGFAGLQLKYGAGRISDSGIREIAIVGQGIGLAMRGLRPIAEIQYLDYMLYAIQTLSDDLASLHYRTAGRQSAPLIVRTRGHRLEGIWHSGSPMGMLIDAVRGIHVCVPRNMVQAVGMYNTLLEGMDPAIVIECLNGYRLKEKLPSNLTDFRVALGVPEIIREGSDVSIVSYGSTLRIIAEAVEDLSVMGVDCEIIDVQTLLPFDIHHIILGSLKKTNRIIFIDEDVPGAAAGYLFNKVMEEQGGYRWLDVAPRTLTAKAHRPAYASDGDYFSKPNVEEIIDAIQEMMRE
ncbi:MAG TPA: thiamine pyrophosphate-dependent enzyme [Puia sp.]|jgi:pyruvate/2-oxoglutarate/acetoin dehydrogenase E1 component/TPP-dependent pyruvate/acetoin dehydrogenase alpha subunit|nr:thiamine pyrophosphate-dependent enzyme [Puia sp.]